MLRVYDPADRRRFRINDDPEVLAGRIVKDPTAPTDSLVMFRNSQGAEARGTLMRLTRNLAVFEVYNPYSIVQLSEVLTEVRIRRGERTIYNGRAVVGNLVSTGLMLIVSATLVDPWSDLAGLTPGPQLREEVAGFLGDWERNNRRLRPDYELRVGKLRNFLQELSRWLEHGEAVAGIDDAQTPPEMSREFTADVEAVAGPRLDELLLKFDSEAAQVPRDEVEVHKAYARRELHPLILCAPFLHRSYTKPLGYAGDYEMVNMILRDRWEGSNTYARLVNSFFLRNDVAEAHRNRIDRLTAMLEREAGRAAAAGRVCRVLNIGCGPADEVRRFLQRRHPAMRVEMELMDFNEETLNYTRSRVQPLLEGQGDGVAVRFIHRSIHDLLKQAAKHREVNEAPYDVVYCAGLFDYLSDRICKRLLQLFYARARPGGLVLATNVHARQPIRGIMEHLAEWYLVLRDERDMLNLASGLGEPRVSTESTGANLFLDIHKPDSEASDQKPAAG